MKTVYLMADPISPTTLHEVEDVTSFLMSQYGRNIPNGVRIYHQGVGVSADVTPSGTRKQIARSLKRLRKLPGPFYVVNHPGEITTLGWLIAAVVVAAVGAAVLLRPKLPNVASKQQGLDSPNNSLSERTNEPRVNGRVPDIVGTVRSVPDLLSNTYNIYTAHVKREVSYMCIGKGTYQIHDLKDDTTPISEISGSSAEVYGPYTSPNSGHAPQLRVGDPIGIPLLINKRIDSINGQTLIANDAGSIIRKTTRFVYPNQIQAFDASIDYTETFVPGDNIVVTEAVQASGSFTYNTADFGGVTIEINEFDQGEIHLAGNVAADWALGQVMTISNGTVTWTYYDGGDGPTQNGNTNLNGMYPVVSAAYDAGTNSTVITLNITSNSTAWLLIDNHTRTSDVTGTPLLARPSTEVLYNLNGTYSVVTVTPTVITLSNPESVNPGWLTLQSMGGVSGDLFPVLATSGDRWVGWFTVKYPRPIHRVIINILAPGGMFLIDDDGEQRKTSVTYRVQAERLDENGNPTGDVRQWDRTITGSAVTRAERADTLNVELDGIESKDWRFRARRLTSSNQNSDYEVIDEIIWNDLYVASNVDQTDFGDVTTVYTLTAATEGATSLKSRRFNTLVTRMIPLRIAGEEFTEDLHPTNSAAEILSFMALDPTNGRRSKSQVDFDSIYNAHAEVVSYFGTPLAGEFCYTFSSDVLSFEEIATQIAQAMFCQAYRRGSKLKVMFEKQTDQRAMLFNHRNVLPGTEEYSGSFGTANAKGSDGVEFQWIDPETEAVANINLPEDGSALKPLKLESVGIRNRIQAHFHAWREYQKIKYQRKSKSFDSLYMANLLIPKNVVLCADGCRPETVSGEVQDVDGLVLYLEQEVDWTVGTDPYIHLQTTDISTDMIPISPGPDGRSVLLARAPVTPVVTQESSSLPTVYTIVFSTNVGTLKPYMVVEKSDKQNMVVGMQVVEYNDRIYDHDKDFVNGIIQ